MKKLRLISFTLFVIASQACNGGMNNDAQLIRKDTLKTSVPIDKNDAQFAIEASIKSMAEVELGKLAIKNGVDKRVKNFGAMLIKDHIKADRKLRTIAKIKKISLPDSVDAKEQLSIIKLSKNYGKTFDTAFMNDMVKHHENDIRMYTEATKELMDPDLRVFANKNLLVLKRHLDAVNVIKGSMK